MLLMFAVLTFLTAPQWTNQDEGHDSYPQQATWVSDPEFDDVIVHLSQTPELPATVSEVWSDADDDMTHARCAEECMKESWCSSFFTQLQRNRCILHEVLFLTPEAGEQRQPAPGARYFLRSTPSCHPTHGFYLWRGEGLCFKVIGPMARHSHTMSVDSARTFCQDLLGGRLLELHTLHRTDWIRKLLLQWPPSRSQSIAVGDFRKHAVGGKNWCQGVTGRGNLQDQKIVLDKNCVFKANYYEIRGNYSVLCEV